MLPNNDINILLIYISSILSTLGSGWIILIYYKEKQYDNIFQKLICYLSLGDLVFSISNMIYVYPGKKPRIMQCQVQGYLREAAFLSSLASSFFISYCCYITIVHNKRITKLLRKIFLLVCFVLPLGLAAIPLYHSNYDSGVYACIIKLSQISEPGYFVQEFLLFDLPLFFTIASNFYMLFKVVKFVRQLEGQELNSIINMSMSRDAQREKNDLDETVNIIKRMMLYPVILSICWLPFWFDRQIVRLDLQIPLLVGAKFIISDITGFLNFIVFTLSKLHNRINQSQVDDVQIQSSQTSSILSTFSDDG